MFQYQSWFVDTDNITRRDQRENVQFTDKTNNDVLTILYIPRLNWDLNKNYQDHENISTREYVRCLTLPKI